MNTFNSGEEQNFKLGISLIGVLLVVLLVVFGVYLFRSRQDATIAGQGQPEKTSFFERLFGNNDEAKVLDSDRDGLNDSDEQASGTNPQLADSDSDGLTDREEKLVYATDPLKADSDNDGANDGEEIKDRRDPKNADAKAEWPPRPAQFTAASN